MATMKAYAAWLFLAIGGLSCTAVAGQVEPDSDVEPTVWEVDPNVLDCSPSTFKKGQNLVLTLGPDHGSELSIHREADGVPFFLVVGGPPAEMKPLMTPEAYATARQVILNTDTQGFEWIANGVNARIFTKPGRYIFHSSDVLESEVGGHTCTVTYEG